MAKLGEFRILTLRETPAFGKAETPDNAADYWRKNIDSDPRHNPDVETLVCLVLNTRRDILGHFIVATGTLDTILCHPPRSVSACTGGQCRRYCGHALPSLRGCHAE